MKVKISSTVVWFRQFIIKDLDLNLVFKNNKSLSRHLLKNDKARPDFVYFWSFQQQFYQGRLDSWVVIALDFYSTSVCYTLGREFEYNIYIQNKMQCKKKYNMFYLLMGRNLLKKIDVKYVSSCVWKTKNWQPNGPGHKNILKKQKKQK